MKQYLNLDQEINLLTAMGQSVVVMDERRAYLITGGFTPADNIVPKHSLRGLDVTALLGSLSNRLPTPGVIAAGLPVSVRQDLQSRIEALSEVAIQYHPATRWRMYQAR